jgi:hypothetical protein
MPRVVRPFSAALLGAASILGAAIFVAVPLIPRTLLAQNGDPPKSAEAGKAEPTKPEAAKPDAAKPEPVKEAAGHGDESAESARILMGPAGHGECVWSGERAITLMAKDDLDTAFRHLELYDRFGCPGEHVQMSLRCIIRHDPVIIRQGAIDLKDQKAVADFNKLVDDCWMNPASPAAPANPPTAAVEKPGPK